MCDKVFCPTCGSEIKDERTELRALMGLKMATMPKAILRELIAVWPGSLTTERLVWLIYQGGWEPESAEKNIHVFIHRLRKILEETDWSITNKGGMSGGRGWKAEYALEKKPQ